MIFFSFVSINLYCQVHWTKHPDNPVMVPGLAGEWDEVIIAPGSIIYLDNAYHMWYWGGDFESVSQQIGYATSPDGITWTKEPNNPVLGPGPDVTWDGTAVGDPTVILVDSIFHMWYEGIPKLSISDSMQIGHATSPDGIIWTKDFTNPVLKLGPDGVWDDKWVSQPAVVYNGSEYHMWYGASNRIMEQMRIGYATSPDGSTWTKYPENPVLSSESGSWDYPRVDFPGVIFDGNKYHMWYSGGAFVNWQIGYATSEDGSAWKKYSNNPVLLKGSVGTWDASSLAFSRVIDSVGVKYKMWYLGGKANAYGIGYAESSIFVEIPDTAFLHALIEEGVDTNRDSLISYEEAEVITYLDISFNYYCMEHCSSGEIKSLKGIEAFINLDTLICSGNDIDSLDLSKNTALTYLDCNLNFGGFGGYLQGLQNMGRLQSLNVLTCKSLKFIDCSKNNLQTLDVSNCPQLQRLNISSMTALTEICVWDGFHTESVDIDTTDSPNICFQTDCNGDCSTVGIDDISESRISIYPNPANTQLSIETAISDLIYVEITSLNGQLLLNGEWEGTIHHIDLSSFQKGAYLITVRLKDFAVTRKIVKLQ